MPTILSVDGRALSTIALLVLISDVPELVAGRPGSASERTMTAFADVVDGAFVEFICDCGLSKDCCFRGNSLRPAGRVEIGLCSAVAERVGTASVEGRGASLTFGLVGDPYRSVWEELVDKSLLSRDGRIGE